MVRTWSGYLCTLAFEDCVLLSVGLCGLWSTCPLTLVRGSYRLFLVAESPYRTDQAESWGSSKTTRGPFLFSLPGHLSSRLSGICQPFPLHLEAVVKRLTGTIAKWYTLGKVNVLTLLKHKQKAQQLIFGATIWTCRYVRQVLLYLGNTRNFQINFFNGLSLVPFLT